MPYGQIIEIMVALILIESAPEAVSEVRGSLLLLFLFFIKTVVWFFFCRWNSMRQVRGERALRPEAVEWLALLPIIVDFYFLNLSSFLEPVAALLHLPSMVEILGLLLFIFYLSIWWFCQERAYAQLNVRRSAFIFLFRRISLLLPILLPYFVIAIAADILVQIPIAWIHSIFTGPYASLYLFGVVIVFFLFFLPALVKWLWRCVPLPDSSLRRVIEEGLKRQGINFSDILLWPAGEAMACTAAVIGIMPRFRYVLLTPCIISNLSSQEIEAVIAHEAEHVRRKHILWYMLLLAGYSLALFRLTDPLISFAMSDPSALKYLLELDRLPQSVTALIAALILGLVTFAFFRFVLGFFMRNFERQADAAVFRVQGHPYALISALKKVALLSGIDPAKPNWHHFSIQERIEFLEQAQQNPRLLERQDRRLFAAKAAFAAISLFIMALPSFLPTKSWQKQARVNAAVFLYEQFIKQNRKDPQWLTQAGGVFFENKMYDLAEKAYKGALKIDPENADALNNLAWLYVKAEDKRFYHPRQALLLAMSAARKKPESYVLDTLAECFFANGYVKRAVDAERRALRKAEKNRGYYKKQLERFLSALKTRGERTISE